MVQYCIYNLCSTQVNYLTRFPLKIIKLMSNGFKTRLSCPREAAGTPVDVDWKSSVGFAASLQLGLRGCLPWTRLPLQPLNWDTANDCRHYIFTSGSRRKYSARLQCLLRLCGRRRLPERSTLHLGQFRKRIHLC